MGITHAIGTGSNDLSEKVGGITMIEVIRRLEEDAETKMILLFSKPPAPSVEKKILEYVKKNVKKPTLANFMG